MGNKNKLILILIGVMVGLAVACTAGVHETPVPAQTPGPVVDKSLWQTELDLNRQLWESKAINGYHFEHIWICNCPDIAAPVDITVDGSEIVEVTYLYNEPYRREPDTAEYRTIPGLFNLIQNAIDSGSYSLEAQYDFVFGYPTKVFVDRISGLAGEEIGFSASNLKAE